MTSSSSALTTAPLSCQRVAGLLETFVDGELTPDQTLSVEEHLNVCELCQTQAEFQQVMANSVQRVVHDNHSVNPDFLARVNSAVEAEVAREVVIANKASTVGFSWQSRASAFALAASIAAWFTFRMTASNDNQPAVAAAKAQNDASPSESLYEEFTLEGALDRLIDVHSSPPKPQITTAELLPAIEPEIGVRIELPKLDQYGARWEGASVVPVRHNQQAASLRYQMPNHRMTLYVFDANRLHVRPLERGQPPRALNAPLYVGQWRGYTVAAKENRGIGYAVAADMDDVAVTRLISEIH
jgi:anti-sigma factor RsiW